jgi:hypothetical protein
MRGEGGGGRGGILSGFLIMENSCDSHPETIALVDYCFGIVHKRKEFLLLAACKQKKSVSCTLYYK